MTATSPPVLDRPFVPLPSGARMPLLGFGTWRLTGDAAATSTGAALRAGYRHIDTATYYGNEAELGAALAGSGVAREEVFLTSKVPGDAADPMGALDASLRMLGTSYLDLWLIHWPTERAGEIWDVLADAQKAGTVRDIGVSNFPLELIDELTAAGVTPAVNQIMWSPLLWDHEALEGHRERGVVVEGYSALRGGTLHHPEILAIAASHGVTAAQVVVRWHLQHEVVVIPKSSVESRIVANADVLGFSLSDSDMARLDGLTPDPAVPTAVDEILQVKAADT